jgi:GT2 family glycosyltransferase
MSRLVEYVNPHPHTIQIVGPNRETVRVTKFAKVVLTDWFIDRYTPKFLRVVRILGNTALPNQPSPQQHDVKNVKVLGPGRSHRTRRRDQPVVPKKYGGVRSGRRSSAYRSPIVGKAIGHATEIYNQAVQEVSVAISDGIGIGILCYKRLRSLQRLLGSIRRYTDLSRTTVFVSDDGSNDPAMAEYLSKQSDIITLRNQTNIGIAGNSNRLLNCLRRFKYKILLNDDVEIVSHDWERFYTDAIAKTNYHHFCFRQPGLYGATPNEGRRKQIGDKVIYTIMEKPHGAVLAFDDVAFEKIGFFDESLSQYGMEHVDWSNRVGLAGLQPEGFHDIEGSERFFRIHKEKSALAMRGQHLRENRARYQQLRHDKGRVRIECSAKSRVPEVSVIIPVRNIGRSDSIYTVVNNIKAQRYPKIEIIIVEQDATQNFPIAPAMPVKYLFVPNTKPLQEFNKSRAFNHAIFETTNDIVLLHDADIIVQADYLARVVNILQDHDACHIGSRVLYLDANSTAQMCRTGHLDKSYNCERAVGYFEGGSIAFHKKKYFKIGGFNEVFEGYGCEDCDFFERLKKNTRFFNQRSIDMFHLWHSRAPGWQTKHKYNKTLIKSIERDMNNKKYVAHLVSQLQARYPKAKEWLI